VFHAVIDALTVPESETSDCVNPDTASVNVIVTENALFWTPEGTEILTSGAVLSRLTVTVFDVAAVFWLLAASVATFAATPIVTVPLVVGVIVAVYVVLSVVFHAVMDAVAVPERLTSPWTKPDTASVKVIVTENARYCTPDDTEILTPGAVVSTVTVFDVAAVFWLLAASVATFAATPIVTVPLAVGVIVAV
jgi:hypothetical protein